LSFALFGVDVGADTAGAIDLCGVDAADVGDEPSDFLSDEHAAVSRIAAAAKSTIR